MFIGVCSSPSTADCDAFRGRKTLGGAWAVISRFRVVAVTRRAWKLPLVFDACGLVAGVVGGRGLICRAGRGVRGGLCSRGKSMPLSVTSKRSLARCRRLGWALAFFGLLGRLMKFCSCNLLDDLVDECRRLAGRRSWFEFFPGLLHRRARRNSRAWRMAFAEVLHGLVAVELLEAGAVGVVEAGVEQEVGEGPA